jgi:hypothetical protein
MISHDTRRVLLSFLIIVFFNFNRCFRQVTSDSSEGDTMTSVVVIISIIIKSIILVYYFSLVILVPSRSQVITLREL